MEPSILAARRNETSILDIWGVGDRFGVVPISMRKLYWAGGTAADTMATTTSASPKEELWSLFADWPSPVPEIIERAPAASINKIFVHDHDPIETWHKDNVILIGDAAHACLPTSGQGACQAMDDAWHLADCLTEHAGSLRVALETFTQRRRPKTATMIQAARNLAGALFSRDPELCRQRDERSKRTDYVLAVENMANGWRQGLPMGVQVSERRRDIEGRFRIGRPGYVISTVDPEARHGPKTAARGFGEEAWSVPVRTCSWLSKPSRLARQLKPCYFRVTVFCFPMLEIAGFFPAAPFVQSSVL